MMARIKTTHVGSLPRPKKLVELNYQDVIDGKVDKATFAQELKQDVAGVVRRQKETGIDLVNDGEYGHAMAFEYDYGSWWSYIIPRLTGLEAAPISQIAGHLKTRATTTKPGEFVLGSFVERRDFAQFAEAYGDPRSGCQLPDMYLSRYMPTVRGKVTFRGHEQIKTDIANFKAALDAAGIKEGGWMNAVGPASCARCSNEYYESDDDLFTDVADAMREEYKAIIDAGLSVQLDDPAIAENWDQSKEEASIDGYRRYTMSRIEVINHALRGLPPDKIRFHLCWGSWHGPHVTDFPMKDLVDLMLKINAGTYSFEAANPRHEHEWQLWEQVKLPDGKVIMPGIVTHSTNVIEHPDLVAYRIERFAKLVGADKVVASTDCGLGGRVHPQIAWAKLDALARGAALASKRL
jgi:5-methyltetrahydropteroyltriglutamate--homocysteine methyltransferase